MGDIKDFPTAILFVLLFTPGFVATRVYDLFIPRAERDYGKALYEVVGYSLLTYAFSSPLLIWWYRQTSLPLWLNLVLAVVELVLVPVTLSLLFLNVFNLRYFSTHLVSPTPSAWDWAFAQKAEKTEWVLLHLKDGRKVGGRWCAGAYTSTYPVPPDIYLPQVWHVDQTTGAFLSAVQRSAGIVVWGADIELIEFFE